MNSSDSKSAIEKLRCPGFIKSNDLITYDIIDGVKRIVNEGKSIHIVWIKGHSNIEPNERVNRLAKEAIRIAQTAEHAARNDIRAKIKNQVRNIWNNKFRESSRQKGKFYQIFKQTFHSNPGLVHQFRENILLP